MSIGRNSSFFLGMQLVGLFSSILVSVVVARTLGPTFRGVYFMTVLSNTLVVSLAALGVPATNKYWLAKGKYTLSEVNANSFALSALVGGTIVIIYFLFGRMAHEYVFREIDEIYITVSFLLVPFGLYKTFWDAMMAGLNRFGLISIMSISLTMAEVILSTLVLLVLQSGLNGLVIVWIIMALGGSGVAMYLARRDVRQRGEKNVFASTKLLKESLSFGIRDHVGTLAYHLFTNSDSFVVNAILGVTNVGYYSLAKSLAARIVLLPNSVVQASMPRIGAGTKDQAGELTAKVLRHSLLLAGVSGILLVVVGPWAVPIVYGAEFTPAVGPLSLVLPGNAFLVLSVALSAYFTFQIGRPEVPAVCSWIALAINIPLGIALSTIGGLNGAAVALSTTFLILFAQLFFLFRRSSGQGLLASLVITRGDLAQYFHFGTAAYEEVLGRLKRVCRQGNAVVSAGKSKVGL